MFALPLAVDLARDAVAREVISARYDAPTVEPAAVRVQAAPRVRRTRRRLAAVLHSTADLVAPTECSPAH